MKSYTDIAQAKKLAEILPHESADMWWAERYAGKVMLNGQYVVDKVPLYYPCLVQPSKDNYSQDTVRDIPCWSLVALLKQIPYATLEEVNGAWSCTSYNKDKHEHVFGKITDNPVDACYELIIQLHDCTADAISCL